MNGKDPDAAERWDQVRCWANEIVAGRFDPHEGARLIWWRGWNELGRPEELTVFVACASEWEDDSVHRAEYEADIRAAAATLLDSG